MPIQLTTSFNVGDLDQTSPYGQVKMCHMAHHLNAEKLEFAIEYGNTVSGDWVSGNAGPKSGFSIEDDPEAVPPTTEYTDMLATEPEEGESICEAMTRSCYEWLLAKGHYVGTIV